MRELDDKTLAALTWAGVEACIERTHPVELADRQKAHVWDALCLSEMLGKENRP